MLTLIGEGRRIYPQSLQRPIKELADLSESSDLLAIVREFKLRKVVYVLKSPDKALQLLAYDKRMRPQKEVEAINKKCEELARLYHSSRLPISDYNPITPIYQRHILFGKVKQNIFDTNKRILIFARSGRRLIKDISPLLRQKFSENKKIDCRIILCLSNKSAKDTIKGLEEMGKNVRVQNLLHVPLKLEGIEIEKDGLRFFITDNKCLLFERKGKKDIVWASEIDTPASELTELLVYLFHKLWDHCATTSNT